MPEPNVSGCNGLTRCDVTQAGLGNVAAFTGNMAIPQSDNFGVARLDHDFGDKWHFMASYRYYKLSRATDSQFDIGGFLGGGTLGTPTSLSNRPQVPWFLVAALTTNITNNITNDFHYSFLRNYWHGVRQRALLRSPVWAARSSLSANSAPVTASLSRLTT